MKITQAVILAGGQGKRLRPFTINNPKPMMSINGKPFLEYLIRLLKANGIKEMIILTGYLGEKITQYFGDGSKFGVKIKYSHTPFLNEKKEENNSGLRLKNATDLLDDQFLLLYCDNYWPLDLEKLTNFFNSHTSDILITTYTNKDKSTKNNIRVDENGYVTKYDKERKDKDLNGVDIGFFIVRKSILKLLPKTNSFFERDILPLLIKKKRLCSLLTNQKYYSIGDNSRIIETEKFLRPKKVIFLDRDGVINKKPKKANYVKTWDEFEFLPGSIKAIRILNSKGYKIFIISNQSGIARGFLSFQDLINIHENMKRQLRKNQAKIDGIYICPHGWNEGCDCRKPKPGMLIQASKDNYIDLTNALFIGDDKRDLQAGKEVNCKTVLVNSKKNLLKIVESLP